MNYFCTVQLFYLFLPIASTSLSSLRTCLGFVFDIWTATLIALVSSDFVILSYDFMLPMLRSYPYWLSSMTILSLERMKVCLADIISHAAPKLTLISSPSPILIY